MICELYNKIEGYLDNVFDSRPHYVSEVSLTVILCQVFLGIFVTLLFAWWMVPGRIIFNYLDSITFKCGKK